jgi:hypothetical protein
VELYSSLQLRVLTHVLKKSLQCMMHTILLMQPCPASPHHALLPPPGYALQRTKAAAAAGQPKPRPRPSKPPAPQWTWQQLQPVLPPEQSRWRNLLGDFLGRPVNLPLFAPGLPPLDLKQLFIEVCCLWVGGGGCSRRCLRQVAQHAAGESATAS